MKNILLYDPHTIYGRAMQETLNGLPNQTCLLYEKELSDYHADAATATTLINMVHENNIVELWSFDYYPLLSMVAKATGILYFSWVYDCPMYTLNSLTLSNDCNRIFCFDAVYTQKLIDMGAKNAYHFPMGSVCMEALSKLDANDESAECELFDRNTKKSTIIDENRYACDISFCGNFYNGEKNRIYVNWDKFSDYTRGYITALVNTQEKIYGFNYIYNALPDAVAEEIVEVCKLSLGDNYIYDPKQLATDAISMMVSKKEREDVIAILGENLNVPLHLYTSSKLDTRIDKNENIKKMGTLSYMKEMPFLFKNSKINLNITSKSIESGIPQRVIDILCCGGFCLTNYQPEIAEFFEDGVDLVMYTDFEDMLMKAKYYLEQDKERTTIARNGYEKAKEYWQLSTRIKNLYKLVDELEADV